MSELIWLFVAALPLWPQLAAEDTKTIDEKEALALAVYTPRPNYPYEARLRREQGTGIAIVTTDPATGYAANAVMAVSTGFPSLDNAAISTFRQWRFKPGRVLKVRIPVTFFLSGGGGPVCCSCSRGEGAADGFASFVLAKEPNESRHRTLRPTDGLISATFPKA